MIKLADYIKMVLEQAPEATTITFEVSVVMVGKKFIYVEIPLQDRRVFNRLTFTVSKQYSSILEKEN